jgi:predicted DNA-binding protein
MPIEPRPGTRPVYVELPLELAQRLEAIAQANRRTLKAEITLAIERHVSVVPSFAVNDASSVGERQALDVAPAADSIPLPTTRGRYLLFVGDPILRDGPRWVHFSWRGDSFCLRDFATGDIRRQDRSLSAADVWRVAQKRIPATGEFFHPVGDWEWWKAALERLSRRDRRR